MSTFQNHKQKTFFNIYKTVFISCEDYRHIDKNKQKTSKQTSKQANKQASKQTNKQTSKQTSKQANKQTNKQTNNPGTSYLLDAVFPIH